MVMNDLLSSGSEEIIDPPCMRVFSGKAIPEPIKNHCSFHITGVIRDYCLKSKPNPAILASSVHFI
jgi:hypothetical protein